MYQLAPGKLYNEATIAVNGQRLQSVDKFPYLGSLLSRAVRIDDEVNTRFAKTSAAFGRLHKTATRQNQQSDCAPSEDRSAWASAQSDQSSLSA